ncbi:MFS transporter [Cellulomonas sp. C5510]|uniref:MFS transporter n=1 Tax=Cellulomonas sp. C5510 TaxID=2871170 RepID=UPI001C97DF46|nr:MFS transporter [Cellulomonas sp. C5510]QZN86579.1 MFS transporter [Cellulomonas sp. C5510]
MSAPAAPATRHPLHRAWWVLVACCLLYGGAVGVIGNSAGIYLSPVSEEMGWSLASLNGYLTVVSLVMTATLPVAGWLLPRTGLPWVLAGAMTLACGTYASSALFTSLGHWYAAGVLLGISYGVLLYIPIPLVINNWFRTRNGLALGIAAAFASAVAALVNPLGGALIDAIGWRETRAIMGGAGWLLAVPATLLLIRLKPEQLGLRPYGADAPQDVGEAPGSAAPGPGAATTPAGSPRSVGAVVRSVPFVCAVLLGGLIAFGACMLQQAPSHAASIGLDSATGATGVSAIMVGGILGKLALGWLHDRYGVLPTALVSAASGVAGPLIVVAGGADARMFLLGCFVFGGGYAGLVVVPPLMVRHLFGTVDYSRLYSFVTVALGLFSAAAPVAYARIHDVTGTFTGAWWASASAFLGVAALAVLAVRTRTAPRATPTSVREGARP